MMDSRYRYHTLANGLKIVCEMRPGTASEYFGVAVKTGSRDEKPDEYGLAHFVEHTIFKGTTHRKSWHILNRMEAIGGELNAFTTKEETYVYSAFPLGYAGRALELIADLISDSQFPQKQIDLEREVVADEIASYLDSPADAIYDDFEDMVFAGSGLGHNILGTVQSLTSFTPDKCRMFIRQHYTAGNMVAFYSGATDPDKIFRLAERYLSGLKPGAQESDSPIGDESPLFDESRSLGLHQSHTLLGTRIPGIYSDDKPAMALLTSILGGTGMNSLLNLSLRERSGLVYTVEASSSLYRDCGLWTVYFGCDKDDTTKCISKVKAAISRLSDSPMPAYRLDKYKKQFAGQAMIAQDQRESSIMSVARATLFFGKALSTEENIERIMAVSPEKLLDNAQRLHTLSRLTFC